MPTGKPNDEFITEPIVSLPGRITIRCIICDQLFTMWRAHYLEGRRCCSEDCGRARRSENAHVIAVCLWCGKSVKRLRSRIRDLVFCSRAHFMAYVQARKLDPGELKLRKAERQWQRYQDDPEFRELRKAGARKSHDRHRERRNAKRRRRGADHAGDRAG